MTRVVDETKRVVKAVRIASFRSYGRAGAYIRGLARRSISKKAEPSEPGKPPRSGTGRLRDAILFAVDRQAENVVIGPVGSIFGQLGQTHEFSGIEAARGRKKRRVYPARPFMGPALERSRDRIPDFWKDSIRSN